MCARRMRACAWASACACVGERVSRAMLCMCSQTVSVWPCLCMCGAVSVCVQGSRVGLVGIYVPGHVAPPRQQLRHRHTRHHSGLLTRPSAPTHATRTHTLHAHTHANTHTHRRTYAHTHTRTHAHMGNSAAFACTTSRYSSTQARPFPAAPRTLSSLPPYHPVALPTAPLRTAARTRALRLAASWLLATCDAQDAARTMRHRYALAHAHRHAGRWWRAVPCLRAWTGKTSPCLMRTPLASHPHPMSMPDAGCLLLAARDWMVVALTHLLRG